MSGSATDVSASALGEAEAAAVTTMLEELEETPTELDVFEGEMSGMVYVGVKDGYLRAKVTPSGLETARVSTPQLDEEITSIAHIDPDEGETVRDAVDSISFAGD